MRQDREEAAPTAVAGELSTSSARTDAPSAGVVLDEMRAAPREGELGRRRARALVRGPWRNGALLDEDVVIFTVGAMVQTLHLATLEQTYLYGIDGEGVGFVCVHPDKTHFALGEKGTNPNVYVYERETLKLSKVLEGGTEKTYGCGRFSPDGSKLATVGGYPDFWLTVWDWATESIVLRSKAFSQDVFDVTFSNFFEGQLLTSGTGHIRFWKMAETFTGLKLQGDIAVRAGGPQRHCRVRRAPGRQVLSGTESGRMPCGTAL